MVTVVGGKLTTYRRMAQDTVDRLLGGAGPRSVTARLPLVGAAPPAVLRGLEVPSAWSAATASRRRRSLSLADGDPTLLQPLAEGVDGARRRDPVRLLHEGALTLDDLLDRRVRLGLVPAERHAAEAAAARLVA